ncbi:MAG: Crp/Fnr family transcriptional regulator, partial [Gammaproteobacteria bacterium]|nr:Crp/Fnr family transcriptional regulator [Gammaproteobacteria bacterium]
MGDPARSFFLMQKGQIKLYRLASSGQEKIIEIIRPGHTFAEAVMFMEQHVYPVSAEALQDCEVISFDVRTFLGVLRHSMNTCFRVMGSMSMRLRARVAEIEHLCLHDATFRLADYLLDEVEQASQIMLRVPKSVLAARLSIQNETLSRILKRLRKIGIIEVHGKEITVLDIGA